MSIFQQHRLPTKQNDTVDVNNVQLPPSQHNSNIYYQNDEIETISDDEAVKNNSAQKDNANTFESLSVRQLIAEMKKRGLGGYTGKRKADLIKKLNTEIQTDVIYIIGIHV